MGVMSLAGLNMWALDLSAVGLELGTDFWVWKIYSSPSGMLTMKFGNVMKRFPGTMNMVWPGDRV